MEDVIDFELLSNPEELARYRGWSAENYRDLLSVQENRMSEAEFDDKYLSEKAVLVLDLTGFTETALKSGAVHSFLRVLDAHKLCLPVLNDQRAEFVRVSRTTSLHYFERRIRHWKRHWRFIDAQTQIHG